MKSTGIVRQVDQLGRIVIPKELRTQLGIEQGTPLEIFVDEESIILRGYRPGCIYCKSVKDLKQFAGKRICPDCIEAIKKMQESK